MQKAETFTPPTAEQFADGANYISVVHGFEGPVGVSFARPLVAPELQSAAKATVQTIFDGEITLTPDMGIGFSGGQSS